MRPDDFVAVGRVDGRVGHSKLPSGPSRRTADGRQQLVGQARRDRLTQEPLSRLARCL